MCLRLFPPKASHSVIAWLIMPAIRHRSSCPLDPVHSPAYPLDTGWTPFLSPNQQCQSTEGSGKNSRRWQIQTGSDVTATDLFVAHIFRLYTQITVCKLRRRIWDPLNRRTPRSKGTGSSTLGIVDVGRMQDESWNLRSLLPLGLTVGVVQLHRCSNQHQPTTSVDCDRR